MPLRLIQVTVPAGHEIEDLLESHPVTAVWQDSRQGEGGGAHIVQFAVPAEDSEAIMDRLEERLGGVDGFRLALLAVQAMLPREDQEDNEEAAAEAAAAEAESGERKRDRISREELYTDVTEGLGANPVFLAMAGLSAAVAALGLLRDDLAVVIGAMVIAPLLQPNVALALAATLGDGALAWRATKAIGAGAMLALGLSVAAGLLLTVDPTVPTLAARTQLDLGALGLAVAAGAAGALAYTRGLAGPVIGVMVSVALLPPLVAFGILAGAGQWRAAFGALLICLGNTICINLAGIATFLLQGIRPRTWWEKERARRATVVAAVIWAVLLAALVALLAYVEPMTA